MAATDRRMNITVTVRAQRNPLGGDVYTYPDARGYTWTNEGTMLMVIADDERTVYFPTEGVVSVSVQRETRSG